MYQTGFCRRYGRTGTGRTVSSRKRVIRLHNPFGVVATEILKAGKRRAGGCHFKLDAILT